MGKPVRKRGALADSPSKKERRTMGARSFMLAASLAVVPAALFGCGQDAPTAAETTDQLSDASAPVFHRARAYSEWAPAIRVEDIPGTHPEFNGPSLDGCPFI